MAGLLDYGADPLGQGLLQMGAALMTPRALGGGLANGMLAFNSGAMQAQQYRRALEQDARRNRLTDAQINRYELDAKQAQLDAEEKAAQQQRIQQWVSTLPPELQQAALIKPEAVLPHILPRKPEGPIKLGQGDLLVDPSTYKPLASNPKEAAPPAPTELARLRAEMEALPPGHPARKEYEAAIRKQTQWAPPPVTTVTINQGQKGFDNERALRGEFTGSATTKAFGEVQGAYDIIKNALANPSGANDLAAATKFMKLLDPGSVVRESELGMAMAATGVADRMANYAQMLASGQKLTPQQRKDFGAAADQIFNAARKRYSETAQGVRTQASKWELDPDAVAPPPWKVYGYKSKAEAINDARNALMKNPQAKDEVVRRLVEELGIPDHGIK